MTISAPDPKPLIRDLALAAGFDLCGVAAASPLPEALQNLKPWLERGLQGEKAYLQRQAAKRLDPSLVLPGVKSVVCVGKLYNTDQPYASDLPRQPWIARYAWGRDYHLVMEEKLNRVEAGIADFFHGTRTLSFCDSGPVAEKVWATAAGLGWQGKNTLLINPRLGSWLILGVILTDLDLEPDQPGQNHCGTCRLCLDACPTGALTEPYVMDLAKCISAINFLKHALTPEQESALGNNLLGCDLCQDVCPFNQARKTTEDPSFKCQPAAWQPDLDRLAGLGDEEYKRTFGNSYLGRLAPSLLRRNAAIVKGNLHANRF